jgi:hypothetical protein
MSFTRGERMRGGFAKPGELPIDVPSRHNREGWVETAQHDSVQLNGKQYRHMKEWQRPCAICGEKYSVFEKVGQVDANSRFSNRTCDLHRGLLPAFEKGFIAWDSTVRCVVAGFACTGVGEPDKLRMANSTMKEELAGLYSRNSELFSEVQVLKARLAQYELPAAMRAIGCETVQNTTGSNLTYPWQSS